MKFSRYFRKLVGGITEELYLERTVSIDVILGQKLSQTLFLLKKAL